MIYGFIDDFGTFELDKPHRYNFYFPLTDAEGKLLSSVSPNLSGDIKKDNDHFLTQPASIEDLRSAPLCRREFFIRSGNKVIRLSRPGERDRLEAGFLYHRLTKVAGGFSIEILNFIPRDRPVEIMRIKIRNISRRPAEIIPTSFIPLYGRAEKNLRDHRHVSSLLNRVKIDKFGISLSPSMIFDEKGHKLNRTIYYCRGYEGNGIAPSGQYPTLDRFYGQGDIDSPDAIFKEVPPSTRTEKEFEGKESCAALRFGKKRLAAGGEAQYTLLLGIEGSEAAVKDIFSGLDSGSKVDAALEDTKRYWRRYLSGLRFDFGDRQKNGWLSWVELQPTLRKLFGCSFLPHFDYGKGGRGWRDLWQDALTLLLTEPEKARRIITSSFSGVRLDGSNATIIAGDGSFLADRNRINRVWMDHGVWPWLTTRNYIDRSGELDLLLEKKTYFRDHQLERAQAVDAGFRQKDFLQRDKDHKVYEGTILEHILVQNLVQFFNVGRHNIIRLENADWNDGLDMAPDNGESAAFSFMYAHNLKDICELLEALKTRQPAVSLLKELRILLDTLGEPLNYSDHKAKRRNLERYFKAVRAPSGIKIEVKLSDLISDLEAKSRHLAGWLSRKEWLTQGFFNGYYDNRSARVEGKRGKRVNMMLASQVFAIMSGVASEAQVGRTWKAISGYLKDKKLKGFRLNTDRGKPYLDLGRAFGFAYGDKENGAFFSHMNVMLANGLYQRGFIREGKEVIDSLYNMAVAERAAIPPVLPEYFNSQGKGLYLYLTGSASWYIHTLCAQILGIQFRLGLIALEPKLLGRDFTSQTINTELSLGKKKLRLEYRLKASSAANRRLRIQAAVLNGKSLPFSAVSCSINPAILRPNLNTVTLALG